jgi:hypothetical protein
VSQSDAQAAKDDASSEVSDAFHALLDGLFAGVTALASIAVFMSFTALSLFFMLKSPGGPWNRCAGTSSASRPWPRSTGC